MVLMKRLIFIIIIVIIILYFQYSYINNHNNSYEILQYQNPNKGIFENMMQERLISIFTEIPFIYSDILSDNNIILTKYLSGNKKDKGLVNSLIAENLSYYDIPLNISNKSIIKAEVAEFKTPLTIQKNYRQIIYQLEGTRRFYIFSPNNKNKLYFKNNKTSIDLWNQNTQTHPLLNDATFIEVILRENQMIYIPYSWIYASKTDDNNLTIEYSSESIFTNFLKN